MVMANQKKPAEPSPWSLLSSPQDNIITINRKFHLGIVKTQVATGFKKECGRMKLMAFDVDGTLSDHGTAIPHDVAVRLRDFENQGINIAIVSGKPAYYLAGLARGMGLEKAKLIGENGCVIFDSATLEETHLAERPLALDEIESQVLAEFKEKVWIQPNRIALTIFPKNHEEIPLLAEYIRDRIAPIKNDVLMYVHVDAVDIIPVGVDKGNAMRKLMKDLQMDKERILAFGDSTNDLPMFEEAGQVILIGQKIEFQNAVTFSSIMEAFDSELVKNFIK
jgi:HAD superfamily hydrolase (TIGR01484 family)